MSSVVISGDTSGAITLAAPAVAGTNTLTLPAVTGTLVTSNAGTITAANLRQYASGNQSCTASSVLTLAHGLGVVPLLFTFRLVCLTAEAGYSAGDVVVVGPNWNRADATPVGFTPRIDATNITVAFNGTASLALIPKTGGNIVNITNANWAINIIAFG
jgi:hypothetical protein